MRKNIFLSFLFVFLIFASCFAQNSSKQEEFIHSYWKKINNNIFINPQTIKTENDAKLAWFKLRASNKNPLFDIDDKKTEYEFVLIKAYKVLEVKHIKSYDKNHNLLQDLESDRNIGCDYSGIINGAIYYNALCG